MCLNEARIGIHGKQSRESEHVRGRLQHPSALALSKLKMLQEATVPGVAGREILLQEPSSIRRYIVHGVELIAQETKTHQADTFLRQFRSDCVHLRKSGREPPQAGQTSRCFPDTTGPI